MAQDWNWPEDRQISLSPIYKWMNEDKTRIRWELIVKQDKKELGTIIFRGSLEGSLTASMTFHPSLGDGPLDKI